MAQQQQQKTPVWFITGCSTGFGKELAKLVLKRGWRVVATARQLEPLQEITDGHENDALAVQLDVTRPEQIEEAVQAATEKFGRIDFLVNNAGYGYLAAIEEGEEQEIRRIFETNVFGLIDLTRKVLPIMRKQRSGHILNISSIGGLLSFAATGYYHATKFAVEGFSEALAIETKPLGIKVTIVEPGPFRTDWSGRSIIESKTHIEDYAPTAGERRKQTRERSGKQQGDPVRGSEAILEAVTSDNPPLRLVLGKPGYDLVLKKVDSMKQEFEAWRDTSLSADYPEFQGK